MPQMLELSPGALVGGKYRVTGSIASRPTSHLYSAEHERLGYPVILKLVPAHGPQGDAARREVAALARLTHPNNVQVLDAGTHLTDQGPVPFVTLEHVEGESLARIIQLHRRLSPLRAVRIGVQVLAALDDAHRRAVVHGDIKPENVLLVGERTGADHVKLIDYGVAEVDGAEGQGGQGGTSHAVFGSAAYAAPELASGQRPSVASDLYAVGALLYECLGGRRPFDGPDTATILHRRLAERHVPIIEIVPTDPELAAVVERALSFRAADRYGSAAAMRSALLALDAERLGAIPVGECHPIEHQNEIHTVELSDGRGSRPPEVPPPLPPVTAGDVHLLSVEQPSVWVLAGDPGVNRPEVRDALAKVGGCDVKILTEEARGPMLALLEAGELGAPWVLVFGDLHVLLEDPLLASTAASGETARMLVSSHANAELLQSTVNACGLDYQVCLPAAVDDIADGVRRMLVRSLELRRRYDELRLCLRDAQDDLHRLSETYAALAGGADSRRLG